MSKFKGAPASSSVSTQVIDGVRHAWGQFSLTVTSNTNASALVAFPIEFAAIPRVVCIGNDANYNVRRFSVTTTGFTVGIQHINSTVATATVTGDYYAIGPA